MHTSSIWMCGCDTDFLCWLVNRVILQLDWFSSLATMSPPLRSACQFPKGCSGLFQNLDACDRLSTLSWVHTHVCGVIPRRFCRHVLQTTHNRSQFSIPHWLSQTRATVLNGKHNGKPSWCNNNWERDGGRDRIPGLIVLLLSSVYPIRG